jgi:hypothetical protein
VNRPAGRSLKLLLCLIFCLVSGCSATQFIYNRVDIVIRWYLDDYVTLSRDQQAQFDERLDDLLSWHRQEELPGYVSLLDDTLVILDEGVPVESARLMAASIEGAANRIQGPFLELLLSTGQTLDLSQRQGFVDALLTKQDELEEDRLARDDEDYRVDIAARFDEQLSDYLGPLSDRQTERIRSGVMEMTRLDTFWLADRRVWITTLSEILIANSPEWPQQVRALIAGRDEAQLHAYREGIEHNGEVILQLVRGVLIERSSKQDKKLRRRLSALRDDLAQLASVE